MKSCYTILVLFLASITISSVFCAKNCCPTNVFRKDSNTCEDGTAIVLPKCIGHQTTLNNAFSFVTKYIIRNDTRGEYLDDYVGTFIVRSPNFCVADSKSYYGSKVNPVAVICETERIYYREIKSSIDESDNEDYNLPYWVDVTTVFEFLSLLFLAATFYIYYLVIPTRQMEDNCLLHFAGCAGLSRSFFLYDIFHSEGLIPDMCITQVYVMNFLDLSCCAWYALLMYCVWQKFKSGLPLGEDEMLSRLRMIGYGGPAFVMILAAFHAHYNKLTTDFSWEGDCMVHQILIEDVYFFGPAVLAVGLNVFFWKDLATHVETTAVKTTEDDLKKRKISGLLTLNRRLFYVFGLPWLFYICINGLAQVFGNEYLYLIFFIMEYLFSVLDIVTALVLVMFRAQVWKCVTLKYKDFQLLQKWQPPDEEDTSKPSDNSSNVSKIIPSEV